MRIAILGYGREGKSVRTFLKREKRYRGATIEILDHLKSEKYLARLERFDVVFRSPGIPYQTPQLFRARCNGLRVSSSTILFFENTPTKNIIGITGSKGKGTTATLLYKILKDAGKDVYLVGNIGVPALDALPRLSAKGGSPPEADGPQAHASGEKKSSWVIFELSSFQLQDLPYSPKVAVVLDTFPEHLDHHKTLREYYGSKANIARFQKKSDTVFFFTDNPNTVRIAGKGKGKKIPVTPQRFSLFGPEELLIPGGHNYRNTVMAATVARHLAIPDSQILRSVKRFHGMEHRLEFVRTIDGVSFINDSASTNPHTAAAAVRAFPKRPVVLIAGGQDKGLDYTPLAHALKHSTAAHIVLFGENKQKIARALKSSGVPITFAKTLARAVALAHRAARGAPSVVVFSPAAASFDMFKNYADRGVQFKKVVKALKKR